MLSTSAGVRVANFVEDEGASSRRSNKYHTVKDVMEAPDRMLMPMSDVKKLVQAMSNMSLEK